MPRGRAVHDTGSGPESCHSSVHNVSCTDADHSTLSTDLSTLGRNPVCRAVLFRVVQRRSDQLRAPELELLICAVSSVTWLKIARRSFMTSLIFLFACITVVWSRPPNSSPIRIS